MSLYSDVKATGGYIDHHASDLYIEANETNAALVRKYRAQVTFFVNQVTGKRCYDVPFAYDPYWEAVAAESDRRAALGS